MSSASKVICFWLVFLLLSANAFCQSGKVYDAIYALKLVSNSPFDQVISVTQDDYGHTYIFGKINEEKKLLQFTLDKQAEIKLDYHETSSVLYYDNKLLLFDNQRVIGEYNIINHAFSLYKSKTAPQIDTIHSYQREKYFNENGIIIGPYKKFIDPLNHKTYILQDNTIYLVKSNTLTEFRIFENITYHTRLAYPLDNNNVLVGFRATNKLFIDQGNGYIDICTLPINKNNKPAQYYHASRYKNKIYLTDNNDNASILNLTDFSIRPLPLLNNLGKELKNNISLKDGSIMFGSIDGDVIHYDPENDKIIHIYRATLSNTFRFYEDKNGYIWTGYSNGLAIIDIKNKKIHEAPEFIDDFNLSTFQFSGFVEINDRVLFSGYNTGIYACNSTDKLMDNKLNIDWDKLNIIIPTKYEMFQNMNVQHIKTVGPKLMIKTQGNIHLFENGKYQLLNSSTGYNGVMSNFFPQQYEDGDFTLPILSGYFRVNIQEKIQVDTNRYSIYSLSVGEKPYDQVNRINTTKEIQVGEEYPYLSIELIDKKINEIVNKSIYVVNDQDTTLTTDKRIIFANRNIQTHKLAIYPSNEIIASSEPINLQISITRKWYKSWWFRTLLLLMIFGAAFLVFRLLQHTKSQRRKIKSLETESLRSYMNPHFISNSLNSINYYILKNDKDKASSYIVKFSKLIRRILGNSDQEFISLSQEIEAIKMYIEIEQMRFVDKFSYDIKIDEQINTSLEIPSFILQPVVENAIWHGLIQKTEFGHLLINISQENKRFRISIIDDGNWYGKIQTAKI